MLSSQSLPKEVHNVRTYLHMIHICGLKYLRLLKAFDFLYSVTLLFCWKLSSLKLGQSLSMQEAELVSLGRWNEVPQG